MTDSSETEIIEVQGFGYRGHKMGDVCPDTMKQIDAAVWRALRIHREGKRPVFRLTLARLVSEPETLLSLMRSYLQGWNIEIVTS